eukprot:5323008-Amphidinium_carterae.1
MWGRQRQVHGSAKAAQQRARSLVTVNAPNRGAVDIQDCVTHWLEEQLEGDLAKRAPIIPARVGTLVVVP